MAAADDDRAVCGQYGCTVIMPEANRICRALHLISGTWKDHGTHGWLFWEEHLRTAFDFLFEDKNEGERGDAI